MTVELGRHSEPKTYYYESVGDYTKDNSNEVPRKIHMGFKIDVQYMVGVEMSTFGYYKYRFCLFFKLLWKRIRRGIQ